MILGVLLVAIHVELSFRKEKVLFDMGHCQMRRADFFQIGLPNGGKYTYDLEHPNKRLQVIF